MSTQYVIRKLAVMSLLIIFFSVVSYVGEYATAYAADQPVIKVVVIGKKAISVTLSDGKQMTFDTVALLKQALTEEYKSIAMITVAEGAAAGKGELTIEPRKIELWKRSAIATEGVFEARVNGTFIEGMYGELVSSIDEAAAKKLMEGAAADFAMRVRWHFPEQQTFQ